MTAAVSAAVLATVPSTGPAVVPSTETFTVSLLDWVVVSSSQHTALTPLQERQWTLWVAAFLLYGVGDTVTTVSGLRSDGVAEAGPVAFHAIESFGVPGLLLLKAAFFVCSVAVWWLFRSPGRVAVPRALAVTGAIITGWNLIVLLG